jgi:hypothetical protein
VSRYQTCASQPCQLVEGSGGKDLSRKLLYQGHGRGCVKESNKHRIKQDCYSVLTKANIGFFSPFVFCHFSINEKEKLYPKTPTIQNCELLHPTKVSSTLPLEKLEVEVSKSNRKAKSQTPKLRNAFSLNAQKPIDQPFFAYLVCRLAVAELIHPPVH